VWKANLHWLVEEADIIVNLTDLAEGRVRYIFRVFHIGTQNVLQSSNANKVSIVDQANIYCYIPVKSQATGPLHKSTF
jgi:hypothetical protein